ncbi:MAG: CARDB domain-containing protein, partial [Candidatus Brocadiaceae bacterium]
WVIVVAVTGVLLLALTASAAGSGPPLDRIAEAHERHTAALMGVRGVVGTAVAEKGVMVMVENEGAADRVPEKVDDVPVVVNVTGEILALVDATARFTRPVPTGVSTGNEGQCSAGTIACRVTDGSDVYALSNNHVYALENDAPIGSEVLQPGLYDTSCTYDAGNVIGTLHDFEPIKFRGNARNKIDAAIALTSKANLGTSTPSDGYGRPSATIAAASLGQAVQKYGRTTNLTTGQVTGISANVRVTYDSGTAFFSDQIIVESSDVVIQPGDSGSLLVTDPGANPVGLMFAGNSDGTLAVANRIDLVLDAFNVTVDDSTDAPITDIAVADVAAPSSAVQGDVVGVDVTVKNVGTVDVSSDIQVTLNDDTDSATIGTQTVSGGLSAGSATTLSFSWDTSGASLGTHTLTASQDFADDDAANDSNGTEVAVNETTTELTVAAISPNSTSAGTSVDVTVSGTGFQSGAGLAFENGQGPAPSTSNVSVVSATEITVTVTAKSGGPPRDRVWDVRVTNPDGSSGVLVGGFTVTP